MHYVDCDLGGASVRIPRSCAREGKGYFEVKPNYSNDKYNADNPTGQTPSE